MLNRTRTPWLTVTPLSSVLRMNASECAVRREHAVIRVECCTTRHESLMNVRRIRGEEKKRMKREICRGRGMGEEGGIPEHKSSTKTDPF